MGEHERLFKTIKKPTVVGSLRENSRLFSLDEIDINLMLGDENSQYLFFNKYSHKVEVRNIPSSHPLTSFLDSENCLDLKKYAETYFSLVHKIMEDMEKEWPSALADINLHNFTTKFVPCPECIDTSFIPAKAVRCVNKDHCFFQGYTFPSVTISKIGMVHVVVLFRS